jgi:hypothetical protein
MEMKTTKDSIATANPITSSSHLESQASSDELSSQPTRVNSSHITLTESIGASNTVKYRDSAPKDEEEKKADINIRIVERIGQGAYGTVFTALDMNTGRIIALKVIALDLKYEKWRKSLENLGKNLYRARDLHAKATRAPQYRDVYRLRERNQRG